MSSIVAVHQSCSSISDSQSSTEKGLKSSKLELAYRSAGLCWKTSHPPAVHVWATASHLDNNFFLEHIFAAKRVCQHPHRHLDRGRLDPKTSGDQLAFQAHLLHRWLQSPQAHGMHQQGSTHPVGQAEPLQVHLC